MNVKEEILAHLTAKERLIERKEKEVLKAKEGEKLAKIESKEAKEGEKRAKEESKQAKEKEKQTLLKLAKMMKNYGKSIEEINKETGLNSEEITLL